MYSMHWYYLYIQHKESRLQNNVHIIYIYFKDLICTSTHPHINAREMKWLSVKMEQGSRNKTRSRTLLSIVHVIFLQ